VEISIAGRTIGDTLTDNSYSNDGYRFHDVFHFSYAAYLGWSPLTRKLLGVKRKSKPIVDIVEDGARAGIIEEAISQIVFSHAERRNFYEGVVKVDQALLGIIRDLVAGREVAILPASRWEEAILGGFSAWRDIREHEGGILSVDLDNRILEVRRLP